MPASPQIPAPETTPPVTLDQVRCFAAASGDSNPIHLSADAARAAGLEGPVLHGMFVAGRFETFLERIVDYDIVELKVRFVRPAPVDSALTISARLIDVVGPELRLRLLATVSGGPLVALGEAKLRQKSPAH